MFYCKQNNYKSKVIVIDGLFGSGKLAAAELTGAIKQSEHWLHEYSVEYLAILAGLNKLEPHAAEATILAKIDELIYNTTIGRSVNLRLTDLTSLLRGRDRMKRILRLFRKPIDDKLLSENISENIVLPIVLHSSTFNNFIFEHSLGSRLCLVYVIRHPSECLEHYASYIDRIGIDPREFTLHFQHQGGFVPWMSESVADMYISSSTIERAMICIAQKVKLLKQKIDSDSESHCLIAFDQLLRNPRIFVETLIDRLGFGDVDERYYLKVLARNQLPRTSTSLQVGFWKDYSRPARLGCKSHNRIYERESRGAFYEQVIRLFDEAIDTYHEIRNII